MNQPITRTRSGPAGILGVLVMAMVVALAGCGGSKSKSSTATQPAATTSTAQTGAAQASTATSPSVTTGPVHATLHGANHTPAAGRPWAYSVHVTDAGGRPLSGTTSTEFAFSGVVVGHETPPVQPLKNGVFDDSLTFPAAALGRPLTLVVVVHTSAGSVALGWPVNVKQ